jgi:hypothetical protein
MQSAKLPAKHMTDKSCENEFAYDSVASASTPQPHAGKRDNDFLGKSASRSPLGWKFDKLLSSESPNADKIGVRAEDVKGICCG